MKVRLMMARRSAAEHKARCGLDIIRPLFSAEGGAAAPNGKENDAWLMPQ
jgi:hypothetical protein